MGDLIVSNRATVIDCCRLYWIWIESDSWANRRRILDILFWYSHLMILWEKNHKSFLKNHKAHGACRNRNVNHYWTERIIIKKLVSSDREDYGSGISGGPDLGRRPPRGQRASCYLLRFGGGRRDHTQRKRFTLTTAADRHRFVLAPPSFAF